MDRSALMGLDVVAGDVLLALCAHAISYPELPIMPLTRDRWISTGIAGKTSRRQTVALMRTRIVQGENPVAGPNNHDPVLIDRGQFHFVNRQKVGLGWAEGSDPCRSRPVCPVLSVCFFRFAHGAMSTISSNVEIKRFDLHVMKSSELLSIGQVAERTGLAVSAVRFYADTGLIAAERDGNGHRRFRRATIRRVSFILICQRLGYSLAEIEHQLRALPRGRTPDEGDWARLAGIFAADIDARVAQLTNLGEQLNGCIGCGCLSLARCQIYNSEDRAAALGVGPRYLLGDSSADLRSVVISREAPK